MTDVLHFFLPVYAVVPIERCLLESALPSGFHLVERLDGDYDIINNNINGYCIGTVGLVGGELVFKVLDQNFGPKFMRDLKLKYADFDDERIEWAIFVQWNGSWSMQGQPSKLAYIEIAIKNLSVQDLELNPILCSFVAGDFDSTNVKTLTTQRIQKNRTVSDDEGPSLIEISNLENFEQSE